MDKKKLILIEGGQGAGKSTLTNWLREKILYSNLYRLTGHDDAAETGHKKSKKMYEALVTYMEETQGTGISLIFDRIFTSEKLYCDLKYRKYNIDNFYYKLLKRINALNYDIYFINLCVENEEVLRNRLKRGKQKHHKVEFSIKNSTKQQKRYIKMFEEISEKYKNIKCYKVLMDDFEKGYEKISNILNI